MENIKNMPKTFQSCQMEDFLISKMSKKGGSDVNDDFLSTLSNGYVFDIFCRPKVVWESSKLELASRPLVMILGYPLTFKFEMMKSAAAVQRPPKKTESTESALLKLQLRGVSYGVLTLEGDLKKLTSQKIGS